mgnify:CR=1 FL=1
MSDTASDENISKLRQHLKEKAPQIESYIPDKELEEYFSRRSFRGALIDCKVGTRKHTHTHTHTHIYIYIYTYTYMYYVYIIITVINKLNVCMYI